MIIDGTPSSCRSGECSFSYQDDATPTIDSIYPLEGQGGTDITIYGSGFSDLVSDISVIVGQFDCQIVSANATEIVCTLTNHPAGFYDISVLIEGMGVSVSSNVTCFRYLLTVESVSPTSGGVGGGTPLTITGNGFFDFVNVPATDLDAPFSYLPWFKYGLGMPSSEFRRGMGACQMGGASLSDNYTMMEIMRGDNFTTEGGVNTTEMNEPPPSDCSGDNCDANMFEVLLTSLENVYQQLPARVLLNDIWCVITESTVQQLTCVPLLTPFPSPSNVSVSVLSETVTLYFSYETLLSATPLITDVSPIVGAVTGGTTITISGSGFGASEIDDVIVTVGSSTCIVSAASDSSIECVTTASEPSFEAVLVNTPNGVAVLESGFPDTSGSGSGSGRMDDEVSLFPMYQYQLIVYSDSAVAGAGSVFGGSEVTISGGIFPNQTTSVFVGRNEAEIVDITMDTIKFRTPPSSITHDIMLEVSPFLGMY